MALQDLSRIILHKTVIGITCPSCGGNLQRAPAKRRGFWQQLLPFPFRRIFHYQCESCGHCFRMYRSARN